MEGNGDKVAAQPDNVADGKYNVDVTILAKNEIVESPKLLVLVVDDLLQFERVSAIALRDFMSLLGVIGRLELSAIHQGPNAGRRVSRPPPRWFGSRRGD